jgi:outer membrane immunogenic protein
MNKTKILLALAAVGVATPSLAADLRRAPPAYAPAYAPAPVLFWNGFYVGGQVGYAWGRNRSTEFDTATGLATGIDPRFDTNGFVGGLHLGYNLQMSNFVLGVEGDFEGSTVDGNAVLAAPNTSTSFDTRWQASVRGRAGVTFGPALLYATGGVAFANLRHDLSVGGGPVERFNDTKTGWTAGAGVEYALSRNWSTRLEYRYTDFGTITNVSAAAAPGFTYQHEPRFHTVRLGVSYRFGQ